ncbi:MAG: hypothetical protein Q8Q62_03375 [Mesorhizobium sp.]|nr:hypothetical protein [Mesorhizobium sp.]
MNTRFAFATLLFLSSAIAASQLSAHHMEKGVCTVSDAGGRTGVEPGACASDKSGRVVAAPRSSGVRQVGQSFLPAAGDAIDFAEIGQSRLDPANRAFIGVVTWIGLERDAAASPAEMAAR